MLWTDGVLWGVCGCVSWLVVLLGKNCTDSWNDVSARFEYVYDDAPEGGGMGWANMTVNWFGSIDTTSAEWRKSG